jgi:hypothetical protein
MAMLAAKPSTPAGSSTTGEVEMLCPSTTPTALAAMIPVAARP